MDGETNLKIKNAFRKLETPVTGSAGLADALKNAYIETEQPNNRLYQFEGSWVADRKCEPAPLDASNILLRGSLLKQTEWVIGVVIFAGVDTKIMRNMVEAPRKVSDSKIMHIMVEAPRKVGDSSPPLHGGRPRLLMAEAPPTWAQVADG